MLTHKHTLQRDKRKLGGDEYFYFLDCGDGKMSKLTNCMYSLYTVLLDAIYTAINLGEKEKK